MTRLYQLVMLNEYRIIEYEVVKETPKYWFVQMRGIPNEQAMNQTFKVKKDSLEYFYSPEDAIQNFMGKQERQISAARRDIKNSEFEIGKINELQI